MTADQTYLLRQFADRFLQQLPRPIAVFAFPLGIETGGTKLVTEWRNRRLVEDQAFAGQFLLQAGIELGNIGALIETGGIDVLGDNRAHILRQVLPGAAVGEEPEAI